MGLVVMLPWLCWNDISLTLIHISHLFRERRGTLVAWVATTTLAGEERGLRFFLKSLVSQGPEYSDAQREASNHPSNERVGIRTAASSCAMAGVPLLVCAVRPLVCIIRGTSQECVQAPSVQHITEGEGQESHGFIERG